MSTTFERGPGEIIPAVCICRFEANGKKCPELALPSTIFCQGHKGSERYIGVMYGTEGEAELSDHTMRRQHNLPCSVWQHRFLIIGPTRMERIAGLVNDIDKPPFEAFYYEEILEFFIQRANLVRIIEKGTQLTVFLHPVQIFCPMCRQRHIDGPENTGKNWAEIPHRKHLCHYCGHLWRPYNYNTIGV